MTTHWADRARTWNRFLKYPLRPTEQELNFVQSLVPASSNIVLLGVTQEITRVYENITAVDFTPEMIDLVWLGDTETKRAILANWLDVDLPHNHYDAVLGDGSISVLGSIYHAVRVVDRCRYWIKPGGHFICRMYLRPEIPLTVDYIREQSQNPQANWNLFRRLIAYYLAETENPVVRVQRQLEFFNELFPDRSRIVFDAEQIANTMDSYREADSATWFPNRKELQSLLGGELVVAGDYPMAECYPYLVIKK